MMRRRFLLGLGLLATTLVGGTACAAAGPGGREPVVGSGGMVVSTRPVSDISEVHLAGAGTLYVTQGERQALTIEAEDNILPRISVVMRGSRLELGQESDWSEAIKPTKPIVFRLTVKRLTALDLSGAGAVEATGISTSRLTVNLSGAGSARLAGLKADELGAKLSGSGSLSGSGAVKQESVSISGAGQFQGESLHAATATVTVTGLGGAQVRVSDTLNVQISGAGGVSYIGNPTVIQQITGPGGVSRARAV